MSFWSQFFAERSAHKDELDLFLAFCVQFQEGDIDDSEQTKRILDNSTKTLHSRMEWMDFFVCLFFVC